MRPMRSAIDGTLVPLTDQEIAAREMEAAALEPPPPPPTRAELLARLEQIAAQIAALPE
jgi:truncated hemoglobin YjbI